MKYFIRVLMFNVFSLWLTSEVLPALVIRGTWQTILVAGGVLSILMIFVLPLLKILFIPINIITFGLMSWFINVIIIYLLTVLLPEVSVRPFMFDGATFAGFVIPKFYLTYPLALISVSFTVTLISNFLHNISEQ